VSNPNPMANRERMLLTSVISILIAPKLAAFGLPKDQQDEAIAFAAGTLPLVYHYFAEYLTAWLASRHLRLQDLQNPTSPPLAAK